MQKSAFLQGKMQKSGVELGKTNVHVDWAKNTKIAVVEISDINGLKNCNKEKLIKIIRNVANLLPCKKTIISIY